MSGLTRYNSNTRISRQTKAIVYHLRLSRLLWNYRALRRRVPALQTLAWLSNNNNNNNNSNVFSICHMIMSSSPCSPLVAETWFLKCWHASSREEVLVVILPHYGRGNYDQQNQNRTTKWTVFSAVATIVDWVDARQRYGFQKICFTNQSNFSEEL